MPWAGDAGNLRQELAHAKRIALGLGLTPRWSLDPLRLDDWLRHCCAIICISSSLTRSVNSFTVSSAISSSLPCERRAICIPAS